MKSESHPTAWKEYFMRETGKNPDEVGITKADYERLEKAGRLRGRTMLMDSEIE